MMDRRWQNPPEDMTHLRYAMINMALDQGKWLANLETGTGNPAERKSLRLVSLYLREIEENGSPRLEARLGRIVKAYAHEIGDGACLPGMQVDGEPIDDRKVDPGCPRPHEVSCP